MDWLFENMGHLIEGAIIFGLIVNFVINGIIGDGILHLFVIKLLSTWAG